MEKTGDLVKRRREELGLSQEDLADVLVGPEDVTIVYNAKEAPYGPGEGSHSASSRGGQVTAYEPVVIGPLIFFRLPRQ